MSVRAGGFCFFLGVVTVVLAGLSASALAATKQPGYPVPHVAAPTVPTAVAPRNGQRMTWTGRRAPALAS